MAVRRIGKKKWSLDFRHHGKRIIRIVDGISREQAEGIIAKYKTAEVENKFLDVHRQPNVSFDEFSRNYLELARVEKKRSSHRRDVVCINQLKKTFGRTYIHNITSELIERYKVERSKAINPATKRPISVATIYQELSCLRRMLNIARRRGLMTANPMQDVRIPRPKSDRVRYLEPDEWDRLVASSATHIRPILLVAKHTGLRLSEILYLKWQDTSWETYRHLVPKLQQEDVPDSFLDWKLGVIIVRNTKNGETRSVPLNRTLTEVLDHITLHLHSPFVFCKPDGRPYGGIKKAFQAAVKRAGLTDFRFHDLRHDFASWLTMKGCNEFTLMELMGHKTTTMTKRYSHLSPEFKRQAVAMLDESAELGDRGARR